MKPQGVFPKIKNLARVAESIIIHMDEIESDVTDIGSGSQDYDEVKRIIINMLSAQQMSTPEIRRYFNISNSKVWKIMSELEEAQRIYRTQKRGRAQFWTGYN
jgi:biotin operon repressor